MKMEQPDNNIGSNNSGTALDRTAPILGALEVLAETASSATNAPIQSDASKSDTRKRRRSKDNNSSGNKTGKNRGCDDLGKTRKYREKTKTNNEKRSVESASFGRTGSNDATVTTVSELQRCGSNTELRKGKWTAEEEEYTTRVIHYISSGLITLPENKTLRSYLAEKLNCDPMRITKKYAGTACLGKRIHHWCETRKFTPQEIAIAQLEIQQLEERFRTRLILGEEATLPPLYSAPSINGNSTNLKDRVSNSFGLQQYSSKIDPQSILNSLGIIAALNQQTQVLNPSNNPAFVQNLTNSPSVIANFANSPNISSLLTSLTQSGTVPQSTSAPPAPASFNLTLEQLLQHANVSSVRPPSQGMTVSAPQTMPAQPAGYSLNNTSTNNEQHAQALLAQIITQLKTLAAMSPSLFQQNQFLPLNTNYSPQSASNVNTHDPSILMKMIQQYSTSQPPAQATQSIGYPFSQLPQVPIHSYQEPPVTQRTITLDTIAQQIQLPAIQDIIQSLTSPQQRWPHQPSAASARNIQSLKAAQQAVTANAANNPPLALSYNNFMSNLSTASDNAASRADFAVSTLQANQAPSQNCTPQNDNSQTDTLSQAISKFLKDHPSGSNINTAELINALRRSHDMALSGTQSNGQEWSRSIDSCPMEAKVDVDSKLPDKKSRSRA